MLEEKLCKYENREQGQLVLYTITSVLQYLMQHNPTQLYHFLCQLLPTTEPRELWPVKLMLQFTVV